MKKPSGNLCFLHFLNISKKLNINGEIMRIKIYINMEVCLAKSYVSIKQA